MNGEISTDFTVDTRVLENTPCGRPGGCPDRGIILRGQPGNRIQSTVHNTCIVVCDSCAQHYQNKSRNQLAMNRGLSAEIQQTIRPSEVGHLPTPIPMGPPPPLIPALPPQFYSSLVDPKEIRAAVAASMRSGHRSVEGQVTALPPNLNSSAGGPQPLGYRDGVHQHYDAALTFWKEAQPALRKTAPAKKKQKKASEMIDILVRFYRGQEPYSKDSKMGIVEGVRLSKGLTMRDFAAEILTLGANLFIQHFPNLRVPSLLPFDIKQASSWVTMDYKRKPDANWFEELFGDVDKPPKKDAEFYIVIKPEQWDAFESYNENPEVQSAVIPAEHLNRATSTTGQASMRNVYPEIQPSRGKTATTVVQGSSERPRANLAQRDQSNASELDYNWSPSFCDVDVKFRNMPTIPTVARSATLPPMEQILRIDKGKGKEMAEMHRGSGVIIRPPAKTLAIRRPSKASQNLAVAPTAPASLPSAPIPPKHMKHGLSPELIRQSLVNGATVDKGLATTLSSFHVKEGVTLFAIPDLGFNELVEHVMKGFKVIDTSLQATTHAFIEYDRRVQLGSGTSKATFAAALIMGDQRQMVALKRPLEAASQAMNGVQRPFKKGADANTAVIQEVLCLAWASALIRLSYDFIAESTKTKEPPFLIPMLRMVKSWVAAPIAATTTAGGSTPQALYLVEELIEGGVSVKYINNTTSSVELDQDSEYYPVAVFLSFLQHVQYIETNKLAFISDLQGGNSLLTDPQILTEPSLGRLFSSGNVKRTFEAFEVEHECNHYCKWFELKSMRAGMVLFDPSALTALQPTIPGETDNGSPSMAIDE
ncbi:hypothetical protein NP233_g12021 [Leucocoprinus birnbaumii]|uniref:Alpha-type protein kinase domain-containing protein n=1 Tax=Leucocoprinus birnbaumii TaxID=56174 RepID=A0AAD5VJ22_9AGAR|nr:hypothetical protein NP233_g12021 [Leucocoprinus birnbaumii]